jgi:CubicO group peptidase (beta-lactamase class C family)
MSGQTHGNETGAPEEAGFDPGRLDRVRALCRTATEKGDVPGLALAVARDGRLVLNEAWGWTGLAPESPPATPETVWLIASVTKPVVCTGICLLLERGELALDDPVSRRLPEFDGADRAGVTLRHLLTHTSGLPDMLPENRALRQAHAPLEEFVRQTCKTPLLFPPGTEIRYQSTGIALLGAVIERVSGVPCRDFLRRELFEPLGMESCALGWRPEFEPKVAQCGLGEGQELSDWDWNSRYWRDFGAPWGGMFASAPEFSRFMQMLQNGGTWEGRRCLSAAALREMTDEQTAYLPDLPEPARRRESWGLGWRIAMARASEYLGDLTSPYAYGHAGATGTGVWNDPETGVSFVFFSNQPGIGRFIGLVSNAVAAAAA